VKKNGNGGTEEICVERFLRWYNKQYKRDYVYKKTEDHFTELRGKLNWDFIAYERDNLQEWIGIEVKELQFLREISISLTFWECLCSDLTKDLPGKGIQGEFKISFPPFLSLPQNERQRILDAFSEVLIGKQSDWQVGESKDIGPDIADKFPNWPKEESEPFDEYDKWGTYRPCKLEITEVSGSGCNVSVVGMSGSGDVVEKEKEAFNKVFKLKKNDVIQPDRQLKLAKERGARKTILLLANIGVDEDNTRDSVQNCLDHHLISHIDCIYLVDMGNEDGVVKIYPS
jgi:hypothetical protein